MNYEQNTNNNSLKGYPDTHYFDSVLYADLCMWSYHGL